MFWSGLLANHRGVFAVQRVRFRSGVPDGSRVGRRSRITVRVACCLLCQLFHHVERVEHQLCHIDSARANPYHRGNNLLLHGCHAFTYLANFLDQVFTRCDCLAPGYIRFIIAADTRHAVIHSLAVIPRAHLLNGSGQQCGRTQHGKFIRGLNCCFPADQLPLFCIGLNHARHRGFTDRLVCLPHPVPRLGDALRHFRALLLQLFARLDNAPFPDRCLTQQHSRPFQQ